MPEGFPMTMGGRSATVSTAFTKLPVPKERRIQIQKQIYFSKLHKIFPLSLFLFDRDKPVHLYSCILCVYSDPNC